MCEVEFWEVFPKNELWFFHSGAIDPLAGCRVADLAGAFLGLLLVCLLVQIIKVLLASAHFGRMGRQNLLTHKPPIFSDAYCHDILVDSCKIQQMLLD